jgi:hypothetical protein
VGRVAPVEILPNRSRLQGKHVCLKNGSGYVVPEPYFLESLSFRPPLWHMVFRPDAAASPCRSAA